ncbi:MAG: ATP-dependent Clp protease adapter ClpS [Gammaproteobacteria bacterium]|nr:ATP-dependent Clp protease adapter ClpS [Gammaproteobacteria bacterium]
MNEAQPIPGLPGGGDRDGDIGHPGDGAGNPGHPGDGAGDAGNIGAIAERVRPKLKKPPLYKVLMLNDDYTPMEFVVYLLMQLFHMSQDRAEQIMLHIHTRGLGVCGVFPREIAETKVRQTLELARKNQHPLQCTMERA